MSLLLQPHPTYSSPQVYHPLLKGPCSFRSQFRVLTSLQTGLGTLWLEETSGSALQRISALARSWGDHLSSRLAQNMP